MNVHVYNFNEPFQDNNGNGMYDDGEPFIDIDIANDGVRGPIWTAGQIDRQMAFVNSYLASAGIRVVEVGRTTLEPTGMLFQHSMGQFDDFPDDMTNAIPSRDEAIIQNNFRSAVNLNASDADDKIDIYFVAPFSSGSFGSQFQPTMVGQIGLNPQLINQVHVGLNAETANIPDTAAHEIMHQLTNRLDIEVPNHIFFPKTGGPGGTTVLLSRRMTHAIAEDARTERAAGNMTAVGNRVLREVNP